MRRAAAAFLSPAQQDSSARGSLKASSTRTAALDWTSLSRCSPGIPTLMRAKCHTSHSTTPLRSGTGGDVRSFDSPDHEYAYVVHAAAPTDADAAARAGDLSST